MSKYDKNRNRTTDNDDQPSDLADPADVPNPTIEPVDDDATNPNPATADQDKMRQMSYEELSNEVARLNGEIAKMRKVRTADPMNGTTPMVLHVSGTQWANNERTLIRCAPSGELADAWLVQVGDQLLCNDGRQTLPAAPFNHLAPKLQGRVQWTLAQAIDAARTFAPR